MPLKKIVLIGMALFILSGSGFGMTYAQSTQSGQAYTVDPELCALMLRKGREAFSRARYGEARDFFRKAVQADPASQKAWSNYDLAQLYAVAEQFRNHGRIIASTAPPPEQAAELTPAPAAPVTPVVKKKPGPAKKEKSAPKEKPQTPSEPKKVEPGPAVPAKPSPAPVPVSPPAPTPAPGGFKILKDEGC
jgi:hypothetical protein